MQYIYTCLKLHLSKTKVDHAYLKYNLLKTNLLRFLTLIVKLCASDMRFQLQIIFHVKSCITMYYFLDVCRIILHFVCLSFTNVFRPYVSLFCYVSKTKNARDAVMQIWKNAFQEFPLSFGILKFQIVSTEFLPSRMFPAFTHNLPVCLHEYIYSMYIVYANMTYKCQILVNFTCNASHFMSLVIG